MVCHLGCSSEPVLCSTTKTGTTKTAGPRVTLTTRRHCCMRRCTGAALLREATSELAPLTTAQLSAPSSIRGCPMSTRPGPKRGLASSLRVHDRSNHAQGPCDARAVRATTRTAPSCVRAGLSYRACSRWRPRPFPALDGGRAPVTRVDRVRSPGTPSSSSSSWTGARCCRGVRVRCCRGACVK